MSQLTYAYARAAKEYIWRTYGSVADDNETLERMAGELMETPTKAKARDCYENLIRLWFERGPERLNVRMGDGWWQDQVPPQLESECARMREDDRLIDIHETISGDPWLPLWISDPSAHLEGMSCSALGQDGP